MSGPGNSRFAPPAAKVADYSLHIVEPLDAPSNNPQHQSATLPSAPKQPSSFRLTSHRLGRSTHVIRGSLWYLGALAAGAIGGFAFWWIAARLQPASVVGQASAMFTAALFVSYLTNMGLPVAVARYATGPKREVQAMWNWALIYTTLTSLVGAIFFVSMVSRGFSTAFGPGYSTSNFAVQSTIGFLLVEGLSLSTLVEQRLVADRKGPLVFLRIFVVVALRLPLLFIIILSSQPVGLVFLMAGLLGLSGFIGVVTYSVTAPSDTRRLLTLPPWARPAFRFATVNWLGTLAAQAPIYVVPLIVAVSVTSTENAAFYLAWSITVVGFLIPITIGHVVLAEGGREPHEIENHVRTGLLLAMISTIGLTLGALLLRGWIPVLFGPDYQLTADILVKLVGASVFWSITALLIARARAYGQSLLIVALTVTAAISTLGAVLVGVNLGSVHGAADGWLIGNIVTAIFAIAASVVALPRRRESKRAETSFSRG
jgi:O-antigen/teichoic acid export membrane protein